jgi:predicted metal-dependent HD superfamily phosphohydrolase
MNLDEIKSRYSEPHRFYHTWNHIEYMFRIAEENGVDAKEGTSLWYAIMFHDIVYDPKANDNEEQSCHFFTENLDHTNSNFAKNLLLCLHVPDLIRCTKNHIPIHSIPPKSVSQASLIDLDLAILGDTPEVYQEYVSNVRKEYAHASDQEWKQGRIEWILSMLARESIYYTEWGKKRNQQAKDNLTHEFSILMGAEK